MDRSALVTGALGFAGSHLCSWLAAQGWAVVRSARDDTPSEPDVIPCDIADRAQVERLVSDAGSVSHVFHLAAQSIPFEAASDPAAAFAINVQGVIHLAEVLREQGFRGRLVYVGSSSAYGTPRFLPITEEHPLAPANPYGISKAAADHYCHYLHLSGKLDVVRMRPFNHSGPGQADNFVLSSFARQIAAIEMELVPPVLHTGNLDVARDFSHVADVVRAYEAAALDGRSGEAYNVCAGAPRTIRAALDGMLRHTTAAIEVRADPRRIRKADVAELMGSHTKLTEHTGWTPQRPFEDILTGLLAYWREQLEAANT